MNTPSLKCSACNRDEVLFAKPVTVAGVAYRVWSCCQCGVGSTLPPPDDDTLHELHSTQYYRNGEGIRYIRPIEWLVEGMRRWRIKRLSKFVGTGRVLDIGCGSGRFLRALRSEGWEVAGLELNDDTATSARRVHGLDVKISLDTFQENSFDLITLTHVLEHLRDPRLTLADCGRMLKRGGVIAVAVPNIDSWQARLTREHWFHLDLPRHLWHFSEKWISCTLRDLGFEQVAVRRLDLAHNIFGWLQSLLNLAGLQHNCLYSVLSSDDIETTSRIHFASLAVSLLLLPVLLPVSVVLSVVEAACRAGGTVEIIARRRMQAC